MKRESIFEKIMPIVDNMTITQLKINQLKQRGNEYGEQCAELKRLYKTQSDELSEILVFENMPKIIGNLTPLPENK